LRLSGASATYANAYDPNPGYGITGSYARQTIVIDPLSGGSFTAGGTWYFSRCFGLRLFFAAESRALGGVNTPYEVHYLYTTMYPPDYVPVDGSYDYERAWPESDGSIKEWGGGLALVWRIPVSEAADLALSAGPSFTSVSGRIRPLGFSRLWLGGHGVLFYQDYDVDLELPSKTVLGAVIGLEADIRFWRHFGLRLGADFRASGSAASVPLVDRVCYADNGAETDAETAELVRSSFDLQPFSLPLSRFSFRAGIVIRI